MLIYPRAAIKLPQVTRAALGLSETQHPQLQSQKVSSDSSSSQTPWVKDFFLKKKASLLSRWNQMMWLLDFELSNVKVLLKNRVTHFLFPFNK